jgi:molybdate transport system regulatory protein
MQISARNVLDAVITTLHPSTVTTEVGLQLPGGAALVASLSRESCSTLHPGQAVRLIIKASSIILLGGPPGSGFSARNQLPGTVVQLEDSPVSTEVGIQLNTHCTLFATISHGGSQQLGLRPGSPITVAIKASDVMLSPAA